MAETAREIATTDSPTGRARLYEPANFFSFKLPDVPRLKFVNECERALANDAATGEIALDASEALHTPYAATTPLLLARYLVVRAGESLGVNRAASAEIGYVLRGAGRTEVEGETIEWTAGDALCLPGGVDAMHAGSKNAVIFTVCNEPLLAYENLQPPTEGAARVRAVHWRGAEMDERFAEMFSKPTPEDASGRALQLSGTDMAPAFHTVPTMNAAINTLEPGGDQRPHRHNGVAITLAIHGDGVYSMIENEQVDWVTGAAQLTPAAELHSHHNRGTKRMKSFIVQDEGLHFYTRTPGFSWT